MENMWTTIVKRKYIKSIPIDEWMCKTDKNTLNASTIWKATMNSFNIVEDALAWRVGNGEKLRIEIDPWVGCNEDFTLSREVMDSFRIQGVQFLNQFARKDLSTNWYQGWKTMEDLQLVPPWEEE